MCAFLTKEKAEKCNFELKNVRKKNIALRNDKLVGLENG
jgi:hypothetical protein